MEETLSLDTRQLDQEWIALIVAALDSGISPEEIRNFLGEHSHKL